MPQTKNSSTAERMTNLGMALPNISLSAQKRAQELDKHTTSILSGLIIGLYKIPLLRRFCYALTWRVEGGKMHSTTLRRLLNIYHGVTVGCYSYGSCLVPGLLPPGTSIGNYCSVAQGLRVFRRNHPIDRLSQHPFFFNAELGLLDEDAIEPIDNNPLAIGHDVWIGDGVTILPGCKNIGNGAIIGACSVVTKDIPPYTIYVGNPAHRIGDRFNPDICAQIERTQWWTLSLPELEAASNLLSVPLTRGSFEKLLSLLKSGDAAGH